jgi:hypothetical protein
LELSLINSAESSRKKHINDDQEKSLGAYIISNYWYDQTDLMPDWLTWLNDDSNSWGYLEPCSSFAARAWYFATGESLSTGLFISTPTELKKSIIKRNKQDADKLNKRKK